MAAPVGTKFRQRTPWMTWWWRRRRISTSLPRIRAFPALLGGHEPHPPLQHSPPLQPLEGDDRAPGLAPARRTGSRRRSRNGGAASGLPSAGGNAAAPSDRVARRAPCELLRLA